MIYLIILCIVACIVFTTWGIALNKFSVGVIFMEPVMIKSFEVRGGEWKIESVQLDDENG